MRHSVTSLWKSKVSTIRDEAGIYGGNILDVFLLVLVCDFNIPTTGLEVYSLPFAKDLVFDREMLEYHIINVVVTVSKSVAFSNSKRNGMEERTASKSAFGDSPHPHPPYQQAKPSS